MSKLRIAFAGCGRIADLHRLAYDADPAVRDRAELYALCDRDAQVLAKRAAEWGVAKTYQSYDALVADPAVDAVEILTPQPLHEEMAIKALAAGKQVSVQKPVTIDLASADRMISAARRAGRLLKVAENYFFYPPLLTAKKLIDEGAVGDPTGVRIKLIGGGAGGWEIADSAWAWRVSEFAAGRGMQTFDHGHHLWSTAVLLLGEIDLVSAFIDITDGVVDSPAVMAWKYRRPGRVGNCEFHFGREFLVPSEYYANDEWIDVSGTRGLIQIPRCTGKVCGGPAVRLFANGKWSDHDAPTDWSLGFIGSTRNFIESMLGLQDAQLSADQARHILAVNLAVAKSDRIGRPVFISELDAPIPWLHAMRRRFREVSRKRRFRASLSGHGSSKKSRLAERAEVLTLALNGRDLRKASFTGKAILELDFGGGSVRRFAFECEENTLRVLKDTPSEPAILTIRTKAAVWAAILLKKQRMEFAYARRALRIEGPIDFALRLRSALGL